MSILVNVKKVANNSLQGELSDTIVKEDGVNVLALLNKGDHRFKVGSTRRTWFPITPESMLEMGIPKTIVDSASNLEEGGIVELNLENPKIEGLELRIQVEETVIPNSYQRHEDCKADHDR
jgi:hypothetical protein